MADLPRGAKTHIREAQRAHARMTREGLRGRKEPSDAYRLDRARFLAHLLALDTLRVPQQVTADALGMSRSGVSIWLKQAK